MPMFPICKWRKSLEHSLAPSLYFSIDFLRIVHLQRDFLALGRFDCNGKIEIQHAILMQPYNKKYIVVRQLIKYLPPHFFENLVIKECFQQVSAQQGLQYRSRHANDLNKDIENAAFFSIRCICVAQVTKKKPLPSPSSRVFLLIWHSKAALYCLVGIKVSRQGGHHCEETRKCNCYDQKDPLNLFMSKSHRLVPMHNVNVLHGGYQD